MRTYSHLIMTAALRHYFKDRVPVKIETVPLLLGSVLPDLPLTVLTALYMLNFYVLQPAEGFVFDERYDQLYFSDPVWIISHHLFHAPLITLVMIGIGAWWGYRRDQRVGRWLCWFGIGCAFHTAIDILTHHHDGPLLWFPFDWQTRFFSPISYWDAAYWGRQFTVFEYALNFILIGYLALTRRKQRTLESSH